MQVPEYNVSPKKNQFGGSNCVFWQKIICH